MAKKVAIIGAGVSGLVSTKACLEEGLEPTCFEQQDQLGGLWYYTDDLKENGAINIYNSLISNTSKEMTCFSDFPFPPETPPFLTHKIAQEYLLRYSERFHLRKHIIFKTKVEDIRKADDYEESGSWILDIICCDGKRSSKVFDAVIICTGVFQEEFIPPIKGMDIFKGTITHSNRFKDGSLYKDKRVVVIGNSHSAGDVSCDISRFASKVYLSVGDGCWLLKRLGTGGTPIDMVMSRFSMHVPQAILLWVVKRLANAGVNHVNFGLQPLKEPFKSPTMVNDELPIKIASGAVIVVSRVTEMKEQDLLLSDGALLDSVDHVIFATGYKANRDILKYSNLSVTGTKDEIELFKGAFPIGARHNTLAFVGMVSTPGGTNWTPYDLQARLVARVFAKKHQLPCVKVMFDDVRKMKPFTSKTCTGVTKITNLPFRDSIAEELGVKPRFWDLFFKNPKLALSCYFGPSFSAQYRLCGPHSWEKAEQACKDAPRNIIRGTKNRSVECPTYSLSYMNVEVCCVIAIFICVLLNFITS